MSRLSNVNQKPGQRLTVHFLELFVIARIKIAVVMTVDANTVFMAAMVCGTGCRRVHR